MGVILSRDAAACPAWWGLPLDVLDESTLLTSELVTNATRHAGSDAGEAVEIRGLHLVRAISSRLRSCQLALIRW